MPKENTVLIYDGVCNLCNGAVDFVMRKDRYKQFQFVALQSDRGKMLVEEFKIPHELDSIILISGKQVFIESDAAIEIARLLPVPWNWLSVFRIIPVKLRNRMYKWIAKNRYRWFGKREKCRII